MIVWLVRSGVGSAQEVEARPPLPESLLTESSTDIEGDAGELEWEANAATIRARSGGAHTTFASVEVEWRMLRNLGVRLEPSYARTVDPGAREGRTTFGVGGAVAVGLFHDLAHDLHLQGELVGRTPETESAQVFEPEETELPVAADLLAAARFGRWTLRATVGAEAGGRFSHAPVHTDVALLTGLLPDARFGFLALEARADWAREAPLVIAPDVVADTTPLGLPFRIGVSLPVNVGAQGEARSYGLFVRVIVLTGREIAYGRTGRDDG